ncbi:MAG: YqeG family HAD IIIA-type phosphatase [Collinsella sp.]|nr:YqeG family HAD IIIA-type phosphatase [Collinsella sp.]
MRLFSPDRYIPSVDLIDLDELWGAGKRALLLDRDNTLVPRDRAHAPEAVSQWLARASDMGFKLCIISNNWHKSDVARSAAELGCDHIHFALKPAPFAVLRACRRLGTSREEAVLIGDQLYTDVWAGSLAGVSTVLVKPQSRSDMWYTHIFRIFERRALRDLPCEDRS